MEFILAGMTFILPLLLAAALLIGAWLILARWTAQFIAPVFRKAKMEPAWR